MADHRPLLVPVGGFLGSGKTTLILKAAEVLQKAGKKAAAILNDQGQDLVDTRLVDNRGVSAEQVTGGCFCCRFSELIEATERLRVHRPDVIFAEAVGSCADISATMLQPLKQDYRNDLQLAPYTVVVDSGRLAQVENDSNIAFLFRKQIEEADLVCVSKVDLHGQMTALSDDVRTRYLSGATGDGVSAWLDELTLGEMPVGDKILAIDYERYARAEAELGWLNCRFRVELTEAVSPAMLIGPMLDDLDAKLTANGAQIAHLKIIDETPSGYIKAAIVRNGQEPTVEGGLSASPASTHSVTLNVRAVAKPKLLEKIVVDRIKMTHDVVQIESLQCFSPAAPTPERRFQSVVKATP